LIDDFLTAHPALAHWRQSPHHQPTFADAEVLTIALLQGCLGVASLKQTYRLVAYHYRSAFPHLCSYQQWMARLQALTTPIRALLSTTMQIPAGSAAFYLIDAKPLPVCHRVRHGRVRLLREDGAYWGKTSKGWFCGFQLHLLRHIEGRIVNLVLTPGNGDDRAPVLALRDGVDGGITLGDLGYRGKLRLEEWAEEADRLVLTRADAPEQNTCWRRCAKPSKPRSPSSGTNFSTASSRAPGVGSGTRSNSRSSTTTCAMPVSSPLDQLKTGVSILHPCTPQQNHQKTATAWQNL
jgi:Transposase DDE domain